MTGAGSKTGPKSLGSRLGPRVWVQDWVRRVGVTLPRSLAHALGLSPSVSVCPSGSLGVGHTGGVGRRTEGGTRVGGDGCGGSGDCSVLGEVPIFCKLKPFLVMRRRSTAHRRKSQTDGPVLVRPGRQTFLRTLGVYGATSEEVRVDELSR